MRTPKLRRGGPVILLLVLLPSSDLSAQSRTANADVVAVGKAPGFVLLATPTDRAEWRVREITLPDGDRVSDAVLSPTGTKLAVAIGLGTFVLDLTAKRPVWCEGQHFHRLPDAVFPIVRDGLLTVINDESIVECRDREALQRFMVPSSPRRPADHVTGLQAAPQKARVGRTGDVVYWSAANQLFQIRDGKNIPIIGKIGGEILDLIPAAERQFSSPGSASTVEFVLITRTEQGLNARGVVRDAVGTFAIEERPILEKEQRTGTSRTLSELQLSAALYLSGRGMPLPAFMLPKKYDEKRIEWTFWPVAADARLYAPVLQFDEAESIRPHRTDIWTRGSITDEADLLEWYGMLDASARKPWVYYRVTSHPGSWLIEYWTYYPIDNGHVGPHPHDTEHVFVEVDKLGGAPRAVLAAAHLSSSPNNVYSSLDPPDAEWPTLPLFAFVELGKHALAPDINHDGFFTFGRDVNGYREVAHVWGVRDYIGRTDDHLNTYRESMMVPRRAEHRMYVASFDRYFHRRGDAPTCPAPSTMRAYELQELPSLAIVLEGRKQLDADIERAKSAGYAALNAKLAEKKLRLHEDALQPERIYRTKVYPDTAFRVGGGYDWYEPFPQVSIGFTFPLRRPLGIRLPVPLPGRIAVEGIGNLAGSERDVTAKVLESGVYVERPLTRHFGRSLQIGLRYERMTSNMFGFFFGVHRQFQSEIRRPDTRLEREVPIRKSWFRLGPMYESKALSVQVGPAWNWDNLRFEVRANYVLFARKGRSRFGIRD